jgi:hypothetical protein
MTLLSIAGHHEVNTRTFGWLRFLLKLLREEFKSLTVLCAHISALTRCVIVDASFPNELAKHCTMYSHAFCSSISLYLSHLASFREASWRPFFRKLTFSKLHGTRRIPFCRTLQKHCRVEAVSRALDQVLEVDYATVFYTVQTSLHWSE